MENQSCRLSISGKTSKLKIIQEKLESNKSIIVKTFLAPAPGNEDGDKKTLNISVLGPIKARHVLLMISGTL